MKTERYDIRGSKNIRGEYKTILTVNMPHYGIALKLFNWIKQQELDIFFKLIHVSESKREKEINP